MSLFGNKTFLVTHEQAEMLKQILEAVGESFAEQRTLNDRMAKRIETLESEVAKLKAGSRMSLRQRLRERGLM